MSISYEEALSTLQAMFSEPWTRDTLDTVLRHYQGHMENTVECILGHGGKAPQILLDRLKNGGKNSTSMDGELARQLSSQTDTETTSAAAAPAASSSSNQKRMRGTPTTLPDDFLRIKASASQTGMDSDEALARMLQDKLFSEELSRNPDFAHLAGHGRRPSQRQQQQQQPQAVNRSSFTSRGHQPMPMPNIMEKLSAMGNSAKFKLNEMAEQFKQNTNRLTNPQNSNQAGAGNNANSPREMRGLLDRDDSYNDAMELASRKDL